MSAAANRIGRWLAAPAPAERLALFRILVGLYCLAYLVIRLPAFLATARLSEGFEPVGVLWFLDRPLPGAMVTVLVVAAPVLAAAFAAGIGFRLVGPAFALTLLVVTTYRSSWGRLLYFDNLVVLHVLILGATRSADAWTLPRRSSRCRPGTANTPDPAYGWPLRLCALVTVTTYVLAGVAKLRIGGVGWLEGTSLRNHVAWSAARLEVLGGTPSPLARLLMDRVWLFTPLAAATVVLELAAPALLWPPLRRFWVTGLWLLHAGIAATMFVLFPYPLVLLAFAPLFRLEVLPGRLHPRLATRVL